jgi:hypothetical protein
MSVMQLLLAPRMPCAWLQSTANVFLYCTSIVD